MSLEFHVLFFQAISASFSLKSPYHSAISQSLSAFEWDYPSSLQTVAETITIDRLILAPSSLEQKDITVSLIVSFLVKS